MAGKDFFEPFVRDESATALLGEIIRKEGFSRRSMYLMEILTNLILSNYGQKIYQRFPEGVEEGLASGGRKNISANLLLRGSTTAGTANSVLRNSAAQKNEIACSTLLESWAKLNHYWFEQADKTIADSFSFLSEGGEARVYYSQNNHVIKIINAPGLDGIQGLIDRISLHNYLFPETNLAVIGFGRGVNGEFSVIISQPYIRGHSTHPADTAIMVTDAGFHLLDGHRVPYTFFTDEFCLGDLHERNVLTDDDGQMYVIDCDVCLNTPDKGYGGTWKIPPLDQNEKTKAEISQVLERILPRKTDKAAFLNDIAPLYPDMEEQIRITGRYDGLVPVKKDGQPLSIAVQADPDDPAALLWMDARSLRRLVSLYPDLSEEEKTSLSEGKAVSRIGEFLSFDLSRGCLHECQCWTLSRRKDIYSAMIFPPRTESGMSFEGTPNENTVLSFCVSNDIKKPVFLSEGYLEINGFAPTGTGVELTGENGRTAISYPIDRTDIRQKSPEMYERLTRQAASRQEESDIKIEQTSRRHGIGRR